ncbi:hypothetical protein QFZ30_001713 [Arthrobacter pascens]|uniref:hypothetical protein n=1 Tax=Arthrobacter pascens TaxID=1677 RepID=UPI00278E88D2|nr:hypothetical protein [Arthrobacter pascens]MDQ0678331.1 hypothetical protein [Arthrobacter pascens]
MLNGSNHWADLIGARPSPDFMTWSIILALGLTLPAVLAEADAATRTALPDSHRATMTNG